MAGVQKLRSSQIWRAGSLGIDIVLGSVKVYHKQEAQQLFKI